jgi:hypothetical protein
MKYWRRHKHELEPQTDGSVQAPYTPIGKKSRYTKEDDILLANYFFVNQRPPSNAPGATGLANPIPGKTSDAIFQEFAKLVSRSEATTWRLTLTPYILQSTRNILGKGGKNTTGCTSGRLIL